MVEGRSSLGVGPSPDHRGGDRAAQGLLRAGAPPGQDLERAADPLGGQDRSVHLWATDQRFPGPTVAPPGGPVGLTRCTSAVLEWNNSTLIKGDVAEEVSRLKRQHGKDILVFGSGQLA